MIDSDSLYTKHKHKCSSEYIIFLFKSVSVYIIITFDPQCSMYCTTSSPTQISDTVLIQNNIQMSLYSIQKYNIQKYNIQAYHP